MSYTKEQARAEIAHLVAHFRANELSLADVPEAQIEGNYIRNLFRFLNWNTDNTGLSVAEWEFVLQRTNEKGKRPDYLLQLDGQQVLFMDAKKVKYDMHDPRWITQVYAYAYSTQSQPASRKIDFAILTDFQEFILLDCTLYAADLRAVSNFRILDWTYEDYVSQFDTLWELLERENVRAAIHTRDTQKPSGLWSRYLSPKKVKANRIPPDKTFLAEMDDENTGWRVRLAKNMKKRNPQADGALITAAVQLLIDRLIFVKALSDREIEADYLTQLAEQVEKSGLAADDAGWFNACRNIFEKLNRFYNGSIFEPRPELEAVTVSNKVVREVIRDLQPENSPYNFAVLPVEILGTIYERFLGRVVRATDQRVKIEDKPEVRKAGGVYYTPQYIVDYIVENTVRRLLSECKTPADVAKLKILDPACGSGSFLLGAYTAIIRWHEAYYSDQQRLTQRDREAAYYDSDGRVRLTAKLKRQILLNNIYGVDIDAQAVEVTRFSLSLKALEDTRRDELYEEVTLFQQTVLPDLHHNIKCGNSLIGPDYFSGQMFANKDELLRVKPFDWAQEFPEVMAASGFDAVIGNPPWGVEFDARDEIYIRSKYDVAKTSALDSYAVFIECGFKNTKNGGLLGFITPDTFLRKNDLLPVRSFLLKKTAILELIETGPVFPQVRDTWCVVFIICNMVSTDTKIRHRKLSRFITAAEDRLQSFGEDNWSSESEVSQSVWQNKSDLVIGYLSTEEEQEIIEKIESWPTLGQQIDKYKISRGEEGSKFAIKTDTSGNYLMVIPENIKRYIVGEGVRVNENFLTSTKIANLYNHPKIWTIRIQKMRWKQRIVCAYDERRNSAAMKTLQVVVSPTDDENSLKYISAILASKLVNYWCINYLADDMNQSYLTSIPIRPINFSDPADKARHDRMVQLVESMLALHKHKAAAATQAMQDQIQRQIAAMDRQIDVLVYELYGLMPDEIAVVEGQK